MCLCDWKYICPPKKSTGHNCLWFILSTDSGSTAPIHVVWTDSWQCNGDHRWRRLQSTETKQRPALTQQTSPETQTSWTHRFNLWDIPLTYFFGGINDYYIMLVQKKKAADLKTTEKHGPPVTFFNYFSQYSNNR